MGLMNSPAMRAYGCGQWMRSHGVNELSGYEGLWVWLMDEKSWG